MGRVGENPGNEVASGFAQNLNNTHYIKKKTDGHVLRFTLAIRKSMEQAGSNNFRQNFVKTWHFMYSS